MMPSLHIKKKIGISIPRADRRITALYASLAHGRTDAAVPSIRGAMVRDGRHPRCAARITDSQPKQRPGELLPSHLPSPSLAPPRPAAARASTPASPPPPHPTRPARRSAPDAPAILPRPPRSDQLRSWRLQEPAARLYSSAGTCAARHSTARCRGPDAARAAANGRRRQSCSVAGLSTVGSG